MSAPNFAEYFNHLTDNARSSLQHAEAIARSLGSTYIGTEHLLLGVLAQDSSVGSRVLDEHGVTLDRARMALNLTPKAMVINHESKGLSETAKLTLNLSWDLARELNQEFCGTEHILSSLLRQKNSRATILLRDMSVEVERLARELDEYIARQQYEEGEEVQTGTTRKRKKGGGALDYFGTDLTDKARTQELDPIIGRENELDRMITILCRRTKNNPVLIGEPGVGKTAIVEGLAQRIVGEQVPDSLVDRRLIMLDLAGMIAGTKYRGEFEERLKRVLSELQGSTNYIVFIDEMHLLVGAGAAEGALDAGSILKPALARGNIQLIGATTLDEYQKYVEKDAALERRFQPIKVNEPSSAESVAVLKGLKSRYEDFHDVALEDEVVEYAVYLAERYIHDRFLPDKAIDLLDESAARARLLRGKTSKEQRRLLRDIKLTTSRVEDAVSTEDYERAHHFKSHLSALRTQLEELKDKQIGNRLKLSKSDLADTITIMTGIPVSKLQRQQAKGLVDLERQLKHSIIGQDEAVHQVARAIRRSRAGIAHEKRPIGSFIFLGPTGVGKTELARVLAREYFGDDSALIKIDMSEFGERHTVARLVGAPAGYVGYEEGGQLTDRVRRQPHSIVLFDEIEKAHPEVFNLLLQILEDGYLTDAKGRQVSFSNTIVVLTSNVGAERLQKEATLGFRATSEADDKKVEALHEENSSRVLDDLKQLMRPELLNRIDKTIVFRALTRADVKKILEVQLEELRARLRRSNFSIEVTLPAKNYLIKEGYDSHNGVRPLRRTLQEHLEDPLAERLLKSEIGAGDVVTVGYAKSGLTFKVATE